jgi:RNA polymerase subunit RPABC4/transcription elongation factor Spt4
MDEERERLLRDTEEERKHKVEEEGGKWTKRNKECPKESWGIKQEKVTANCSHCGLRFSKTISSGMTYYYCKRCKELQTATTKRIEETYTEREYKGFWQWLRHKPATIKRTVHAKIVDCKPTCHICKRDDMMVPYDGKHCPVCGNKLEFVDELFG